MESQPTLGGCYTCRFTLAEPDVEPVLDSLRAAGRQAVVDQRLLAIEFTDGFDALFVRIVSTDSEESSPDRVAAVIAEFEDLDLRRGQVLVALRRHAVTGGVALNESDDSHWRLQSGCATSGIHVGPVVTRLLARHTAGEALVRLVERSLFPALTPHEAEQLIQTTTPIPQPVVWRPDDEIGGLFGPNSLSLDWDALEGGEALPREPGALLETLAPTRHAPGQIVVNQLVQRVGNWRFSTEIGKGAADLKFTDKLDEYSIHPRSKKLARDVARDGVEAIVDRLAGEFVRLDEARARTLKLVQAVMAGSGHFLDDDREEWWFGKTHRLAKFSLGRSLTLALHRKTPEQVVHAWLTEACLLSTIPSEAELEVALATPAELSKPAKRWLPEEPPHKWARLPQLTDLDCEDFDRRALDGISAAIQAAKVEPGVSRIDGCHDLSSLWAKPFWYRMGDAWASEPFWCEFAEKAWGQTRRQLAAVLLVRTGRMPVDLDPDELFRQCERWYSEDFEDEFLWQFIDRLPWPVDEEGYPRLPNHFHPRPPQIARRAVRVFRAALAQCREARLPSERWGWLEQALAEVAKLDLSCAKVWLRSEEVAELEQYVRSWAAKGDFIGHDWDPAFEVAAEFGWCWLPTALADNPFFMAAQSYIGTHFGLGELALKLSWVEPSGLAARFAAVALRNQSMGIAYSKTMSHFAAGIAWQRCRGRW